MWAAGNVEELVGIYLGCTYTHYLHRAVYFKRTNTLGNVKQCFHAMIQNVIMINHLYVSVAWVSVTLASPVTFSFKVKV